MMPKDYNSVIAELQKQKQIKALMSGLVDKNKTIVEMFDGLSSISKTTIKRLLPNLSERIEEIRNIIEQNK